MTIKIQCGQCKNELPIGFRAFEDHGGILVECPTCKAELFIGNSMLLEVENDPTDFDMPIKVTPQAADPEEGTDTK